MKKIMLLLAFIAGAQVSFGQAVIGTLNSNELHIYTNNTARAVWTTYGSLLIGLFAETPANTDRKVRLNGYDLYVGGSSSPNGNARIVMEDGHEIVGAVTYPGTSNYSRLRLHDGGYGDIYMNARRSIFLQEGGGAPVYVNYTRPTDPFGQLQATDILQVNGSIKGDGYVANINSTAKTSSYTLTNSDYTIMVDPQAGAVSITLPVNVTAGRIFVIKNVDGATPTPSGNNITLAPVSGTIDGASNYQFNTLNQSVQVQFDGTNYFIIN